MCFSDSEEIISSSSFAAAPPLPPFPPHPAAGASGYSWNSGCAHHSDSNTHLYFIFVVFLFFSCSSQFQPCLIFLSFFCFCCFLTSFSSSFSCPAPIIHDRPLPLFPPFSREHTDVPSPVTPLPKTRSLIRLFFGSLCFFHLKLRHGASVPTSVPLSVQCRVCRRQRKASNLPTEETATASSSSASSFSVPASPSGAPSSSSHPATAATSTTASSASSSVSHIFVFIPIFVLASLTRAETPSISVEGLR